MSYDHPTETWLPEDIDLILALLPTIEGPGFVAGQWHSNEGTIVDGQKYISMPSIDYHPAIKKLSELLYKTSAYVDAYAPLPEDRDLDLSSIDPDLRSLAISMQINHTPEFLQSATLNQVRRFLILITRGERFCEGCIAGAVESGRVVAALRRLAELRRNM